MNREKIRFILFLVLIGAQLMVPLSMILSRELVLSSGQEFRFRVEPLDPLDLFRGRYVYLRVPGVTRALRAFSSITRGTGYALLEPDGEFWRISRIVTRKPEAGVWLLLKHSPDGGWINPFDRFYLNQNAAPRVERLLERDNTAYISVMIRKGKGIIRELYVDGQGVGNGGNFSGE